MRIANGYNPYAYQQQSTNTERTGFAELLTNQTKAAKNDAVTLSSMSASSSPVEAPRTEKFTNFANDILMWEAARENRTNAANYPATLTQEQIDDLKSRYNFENLEWPSHESAALGEELFDLGVINDDQRKFFYGAERYIKDDFPLGILTPAGETETRQLNYERQPGDSMMDILLKELAVRQKNLDFMKSPDSVYKRNHMTDDGIPLEKHIMALEEYMSQYQNIIDVLQQLTA